MHTRSAQAADIADIADLLNREIRDGVAHFGTEPIDPEELLAQWQMEAVRYPWLVCRDKGGFCGFAKAGPWKSRGGYARSVEISVYLEARGRGRGLASWLYADLFERLWCAGFHTVVAGITLPNPTSVRLHERHGMRHIGTFERIGYKGGAWRDVGYWLRHLAE